jgi:hypothetical protein
MTMQDIIAAHLAAWKAFQAAPTTDRARAAEAAMSEALEKIMATPCQSTEDARSLALHLDWYVKEECSQAEDTTVALLAAMRWAQGQGP